MKDLKAIGLHIKRKSARRRREHCALAVVGRSQKFRPVADPLPGGAGRPKFNQLEMAITHIQFGEDRCTQFRVIVVTPSHTQTHTHTHTHTHTPTDRTDYNTLRRS